MKPITLLLWALLPAAPVFSQQALWSDPQLSADGPKWFQLDESEPEVRSRLGQPAMVVDFGEYRSWQYQIGEVEHDDFSHALVFRKSDGKLVSVSRSYEPERNVDAFFPAGETTVHWFRAARQADFAMPGRRICQLVLMRESELRHFYPWLEEDFTGTVR